MYSSPWAFCLGRFLSLKRFAVGEESHIQFRDFYKKTERDIRACTGAKEIVFL